LPTYSGSNKAVALFTQVEHKVENINVFLADEFLERDVESDEGTGSARSRTANQTIRELSQK